MNILTTVANSLRLSIANTKARNERTKAVESALIAATIRHPDFCGVMFDKDLLSNEAAGLMQPFLNGGTLPTADSLAAVWAEQLPLIDGSRERAVANIMPMIEDFIYVLESSTFVQKAATLTQGAAIQPAQQQVPAQAFSGI